MGWNPKLRLPELRGLRLFVVTGCEKILILHRPLESGVEIPRVVHGSQWGFRSKPNTIPV
jgi:plasmid stabilization system protein ParE